MEIVFDKVWAEALVSFPELANDIPKVMNAAVYAEAQDLRKRIVTQFREQKPASGSWAPLSDLTIRARRVQGFKGSKILIRTADMRNSIQVQKVAPGVVFVGVNRSAGNVKDGKMALVNLGLIHEFGATIHIKVTRKMQRFLFGVLLKTQKGRDIRGKFLKKGAAAARPKSSGNFKLGATLTIRIPARPFIGPAVEAKTQAEYEASIGKRIADGLKGKLGTP